MTIEENIAFGLKMKKVPKEEIHKYGRAHDINILTLNQKGLKNLFKIISFANTGFVLKGARIPASIIISQGRA